jgi:hypothetical protein
LRHYWQFRSLPKSLDPPALPAAAEALKVTPNASVKLKYHFLAVGKQI